MKDSKFRVVFSALAVFSLLTVTTVVKAGPVRSSQVVHLVSGNPTKSGKTAETRLRVVPQGAQQQDETARRNNGSAQQDNQQQGNSQPRVQDDEVIAEITEEGPCDCPDIPGNPERIRGGGFPYWVLGFAAIPLIPIFIDRCDEDEGEVCDSTPTPTPSPSPSGSPGESPSPTPSVTPSATPSPSASQPPPSSPTPPVSPSETPPIPEPMTLLLFGTGLAGLGAAAKRRMRRRTELENVSEDKSGEE